MSSVRASSMLAEFSLFPLSLRSPAVRQGAQLTLASSVEARAVSRAENTVRIGAWLTRVTARLCFFVRYLVLHVIFLVGLNSLCHGPGPHLWFHGLLHLLPGVDSVTQFLEGRIVEMSHHGAVFSDVAVLMVAGNMLGRMTALLTGGL